MLKRDAADAMLIGKSRLQDGSFLVLFVAVVLTACCVYAQDGYEEYGGDGMSRNAVEVNESEELTLPVYNVTGSKGRATFINHNLLFPTLCQAQGKAVENSVDGLVPSCLVQLARGVLISVKNSTSGEMLDYDNADLHMDEPDGPEVTPEGPVSGGDSNMFVMVEEPYTNSNDVLFTSGPCHAHYVVDVFSPRTAPKASLRAKVCIDVVNHRPQAFAQFFFIHRKALWAAPVSDDDVDGHTCGNLTEATKANGLRPFLFSAKMTSDGGDVEVDDFDSTDKSRHELQQLDLAVDQLEADGWSLSSDRTMMCPATSSSSLGAATPSGSSSAALSTSMSYSVLDDEELRSFPSKMYFTFVEANESIAGSLSGAALGRSPFPRISRLHVLPMVVVCAWVEEESDVAGSDPSNLPRSACPFRMFSVDLLSSTIANTIAVTSDADSSSKLLPIDLRVKFSSTSESEGSYLAREDILYGNSVARSARDVEDYYNAIDSAVAPKAILPIRAVADDNSNGKSGGGGELESLLVNTSVAVSEGTVKTLHIAGTTNGDDTRVDSDLANVAESMPAELLVIPTSGGPSGSSSSPSVAICGPTQVEWVSFLDVPLKGCVDTSYNDDDCAIVTAATDAAMNIGLSTVPKLLPIVIAFNVSLGPLYAGPNTSPKKQPSKLVYRNRELLFRIARIKLGDRRRTAVTDTSIGGCFFHAVLLRRVMEGDVLLSEPDLAWIPVMHGVNRSANMFSADVCGDTAHAEISIVPMIGGKGICSHAKGSSAEIIVSPPESESPPPRASARKVVRKRQLFEMPKQYDSDDLLDSAHLPQYISSADGSDADISPTVIPITLDDAVPFYKRLQNMSSSTGSETPLLLRYEGFGGLHSLFASVLNKGVTFPVGLGDGGGGAVTPRTVIVAPPTSIADEITEFDDSYLAAISNSINATLRNPLVESIIALVGAFKRLAFVSPTFPRSFVSPRSRFAFVDLLEPKKMILLVDTMMVSDGTPQLELFDSGENGGGVEPPVALVTKPYSASRLESVSKLRMFSYGLQRRFESFVLPDVYDRARRRQVQTILRVRLYAGDAPRRRRIGLTFTTSAFMSTTNLDRIARLVITKEPTVCRVLASNASVTTRYSKPSSSKAAPFADEWRDQRQQAQYGDPFSSPRFFLDVNGIDRVARVLLDVDPEAAARAAGPKRASLREPVVILDEVRFAAYNGNFHTSNEVSVEIEIVLSSVPENEAAQKPTLNPAAWGGGDKKEATSSDRGVTLVEEGGTSSAAAMERWILFGALAVIVAMTWLKRGVIRKLAVALCCPNRGWALLEEEDDDDDGEMQSREDRRDANKSSGKTKGDEGRAGHDESAEGRKRSSPRSSTAASHRNNRGVDHDGSGDALGDDRLSLTSAAGGGSSCHHAKASAWDEDYSDDDDFFNEPAPAAATGAASAVVVVVDGGGRSKPPPRNLAEHEPRAVVPFAGPPLKPKSSPAAGFGHAKKLPGLPMAKQD